LQLARARDEGVQATESKARNMPVAATKPFFTMRRTVRRSGGTESCRIAGGAAARNDGGDVAHGDSDQERDGLPPRINGAATAFACLATSRCSPTASAASGWGRNLEDAEPSATLRVLRAECRFQGKSPATEADSLLLDAAIVCPSLHKDQAVELIRSSFESNGCRRRVVIRV